MNAPSRPLVSFCIPFYGSVPLLKRALDSLVAQTDGDFEAVVVDDQSPASAASLASSYDQRFRFVLQPENLGPYQARVRGIAEARGDYVVDVDCDDYVLPELVAEIRKAVDVARPDMVIYNVEQDADGTITPHWCHYEAGAYVPHEVLERMVSKQLQWNFWAKAIRREIVVKTWEVVPELTTARVLAPDDYCATVPMVLQSNTIVVIPYVGYRYWQNPNSICHGVSFAKARKACADTHEAKRIVMAYADAVGADKQTRKQIEQMAHMILGWWRREYVATIKRGIKRMLGWR